MDKDVVYIYNGMLTIGKNKIMPFAETQMNLEIIILSEVSQSEKTNTYHLHMESEKEQVNLFTKQKQTHTEKTNLWLPQQKVGGRNKLGKWN